MSKLLDDVLTELQVLKQYLEFLTDVTIKNTEVE